MASVAHIRCEYSITDGSGSHRRVEQGVCHLAGADFMCYACGNRGSDDYIFAGIEEREQLSGSLDIIQNDSIYPSRI